MTHETQDISGYHAGDAREIEVTVEDDAGNNVDITGAQEIEYYIKEDEGDPDGEALLEKSLSNTDEIEITDGANGMFTVYIDTGDTDGMTGSKHHRARLTDGDGNRSTLFTGNITIEV